MLPGWAQRGEGELIQYTIGLIHDAFAERCRQTVWLMLPSLAPSDALARIGADRAIPRGLFEPEASYRPRLIAWRFPRGHRVRGNAFALLEQVSKAIRGTDYRTVDIRGTEYSANAATPTRGVTWDWDGAALTPNWARYWVVVQSEASPPGVWGDAEDDTTWGSGEHECWGSPEIDPGEVAAVKTLVSPQTLGWSPAGRRPVYLVIWFQGQAYPVPGGDWDQWKNRSTDFAYVPLNRHDT